MENFDSGTITQLPILDRFIKEAVRLNPLDECSLLRKMRTIESSLIILAVAVRRKALKPFTFSHNGSHVATGQIACLSGWELLHESRYPDHDEFQGFLFVENHATGPAALSASKARGTSFTEASKDFPIWGLGSKAW